MKLKRIISALIVFTMVMTCAVCVSADGATYQTMTTYDVSTGDITVNAKLAGAAEGSMVSYIIYGDADDKTVDAVAENNIVHIDQATVGADGNATFDAVTTDFADFKNRHVQFVSNEEELAALKGGSKTTRYASVDTITDMQTSVVFVGQQVNAKSPTIYAMVDGVPTKVGEITGNIGTGSNWGTTEGIENYIPNRSATVDLKSASAIMVDLGTKNGRDSHLKVKFNRYAGSYSGAAKKEEAGDVVYATSTSQATSRVQGEGYKNLLVGGLYKDDITDNEFAGLELFGGDLIGIHVINEPGNSNASYAENPAAALYATVYEPMVGEYTNNNGTFDSVTFLCGPAAAAYDLEEFGLNIYRYEKVANSADAELELIASCPSPVDGRFGIQLFDGANAGELDPEVYDFEAFPYVVIDGEKIELSVFGDTYLSNPSGTDAEGNTTNYGSNYYYLRDRNAVSEAADAE